MNEFQKKLDQAIADFSAEKAGIRTGRATPALVEDILVEAYGVKQPIKAVAAISAPDARQIVIQPWDKSMLQAIERAIQASPLGMAPIADKDSIRLSLPPLTEERKHDFVKLLRSKLEEAHIKIRQARDEAMKGIETRAKAKEISEDQKFREKEAIEKVSGEANKNIATLAGEKEREIMAG